MADRDPAQPLSRRQLLRRVAAGAGQLGLALALGACGSPLEATPPPTPQPQRVVLWSFLGPAADAVGANFSKAHPEITLTIEQRRYDRSHTDLIRTLGEGEGAPDIFMSDISYLGRIREAGGLTDLASAPFDAATIKGDMVESLWGYGTFEGRQVALPWALGVGLGWYRPDVLSAAGLPSEPEDVQREAATWEGWLALDAALRRANPKTALIGSASDLFRARAAQQGIGWLEGNRLLIEERGVPAAKLVQAALDSDIPAASGGDQIMRRIVDGRLSGMVDGSWQRFFLQQEALQTNGQWRVIRAPGGDYLAGALFLGIPAQSRVKEAAWAFVRYMCASAEGQNATFAATGAFPPYRPAWADPLYGRPVDFFGGQVAYRLIAEAADNLPGGAVSPHDQALDDIVQRAAEKVAREGADPEQAMADAEAEALGQIPDLTR
jgi:multiple sugar transport system substrate-binding protein